MSKFIGLEEFAAAVDLDVADVLRYENEGKLSPHHYTSLLARKYTPEQVDEMKQILLDERTAPIQKKLDEAHDRRRTNNKGML